MDNYKDITMALAGVFQSVQQVIQLAKTGNYNERIVEPLISSVMKLDADSCEQVYGKIANLKPGLRLIEEQLAGGASGKNVELGRYVATILNIERQLNRSNDMQNTLSTRINQTKRLLVNEAFLDEDIIKSLAEIYKDTISTLSLRVQVTGDQQILQRSEIQDKVRCCLLCAIRSAVLWRQMGGKRRQLILKRKLLIRVAGNLLLSRV